MIISKLGERLRGWLILSALLVVLVVLPVVSLNGYFGDFGRLIGQIILTIVLIVACIGTGIFGYICIRAQARSWGASLLVIGILCVLTVFWVWTGRLLLVI